MPDKYFIAYPLILIFALGLTVIFEHYLIPYLKSHAKQPIYEGGPKWHIAKSGTPTMGGLGFIGAFLISMLLPAFILFKRGEGDALISLGLITAYSLANGLVGIFDDAMKLKRKKNGGLTPTQKLFFQILLAIIFLMVRAKIFEDKTSITFMNSELALGWLYYPLAILLLVGMVNFANLTDGVDGLASITAFCIGVVLFFVSATYFPDVAAISIGLIGITVGFLIFNLHPAKVFMGDTGSLFLGALAVSSAFALQNPLLIFFVGSVYVLEGISVIIQVLAFKLTKRRVFKMAPLHHHLERCGLGENTICIIAVFVTLVLSLIALPVFRC